MKYKVVAVLVALSLLVCCLPALASEDARYPALRGTVTDDANVLSKEMVSDIGAFAGQAQSRTGVSVYVAIVHFLDGVDAQTYANTLFTRWELGEDDFLLLGAVGEDAFASAAGKQVKKTLNDSNAQGLLFTSGFSELFKAQNYDAAFGQYFIAFADMLNKQYAADIRLSDLFADFQPQAQTTPAPSQSGSGWSSFASSMWDGFNENFNNNARDYDEYHEQRERESRGLTPAGWIVLGLLVLLIFGQSDPARKARRRGCSGCGCSPIGWVFGLIGLGSLFRKDS